MFPPRKISQIRYEVKQSKSKYHKLAINYDKIAKAIARKLSNMRCGEPIYEEYKATMIREIKEQDKYQKKRLSELQIGTVEKQRDEYQQNTMCAYQTYYIVCRKIENMEFYITINYNITQI